MFSSKDTGEIAFSSATTKNSSDTLILQYYSAIFAIYSQIKTI